ncbi:hypothetical protein AMELA_G00143430 [Ameiurus melas]|uniref:Uncharacterized protein n=1 Tax=Ameiurus melas TaxID=219545 RepID=A0A7J6AND1_AMEME|nr:hypothetical protein AMELA_G00143430 [Ameiurus melas]
MTSNMSVSGEQDLTKDQSMGKRSDSPEPSCVSMKSGRSMDHPIKFRDRASSPDVRPQQKKSNLSRNQVDSIFKELEHKVISLIKNELKSVRPASLTKESGMFPVIHNKLASLKLALLLVSAAISSDLLASDLTFSITNVGRQGLSVLFLSCFSLTFTPALIPRLCPRSSAGMSVGKAATLV